MKEQFVTYEIALKLKKLGFDKYCLGCYEDNNSILLSIGIMDKTSAFTGGVFGAPLWQQAIDFLRENHDIDIWIEKDVINGKYYIQIPKVTETVLNDHFNRWSDSYPEAREKAILKVLELIGQ